MTTDPVRKDVASLILEALPRVSDFAGSLNNQCHCAAFAILAENGIQDKKIYAQVCEGLWNAKKPQPPRQSSSHCSRTADALARIEDEAPVLTIFTTEQPPTPTRQEEQLALF